VGFTLCFTNHKTSRGQDRPFSTLGISSYCGLPPFSPIFLEAHLSTSEGSIKHCLKSSYCLNKDVCNPPWFDLHLRPLPWEFFCSLERLSIYNKIHEVTYKGKRFKFFHGFRGSRSQLGWIIAFLGLWEEVPDGTGGEHVARQNCSPHNQEAKEDIPPMA
jgi:hypothetical protein